MASDKCEVQYSCELQYSYLSAVLIPICDLFKHAHRGYYMVTDKLKRQWFWEVYLGIETTTTITQVLTTKNL